jgi:hypothetical protein
LGFLAETILFIIILAMRNEDQSAQHMNATAAYMPTATMSSMLVKSFSMG